MHLPYFRGKKVVPVVVILLFTAVGTVLAGGQQEDPIATARDLIIRNRLNDAIILLTETVRKNPDLIDQAEGLMQKIRSIRGEYYTLWEELINTIRNEPDKPEKAIAIINKMKQLDAAPNERTKQNINEWENIVQFRYNLDRFNKIMVAGDQLLRQSRFEEAIKTYTEGFDIFRPEFEAAGYSQQQVVDRANEEARQVSASVDQFLADMSKVSTAAKSFSSALPSGTPEEMAAQYSQFASQFTQVLTVHQTLESAAETFKNLNDEVRKERPSLQQDWYLTFMSWYIRGRPESNSPEGIGAAISAFLDQSQAVADAAMKARASADYEKALAAFESGPPDRATAAFSAAQSTSLLGLDLERLWERRLNPGPGLGLSSTDRSAVEAHLPVYLQYEYQARASQSYLEMLGIRSDTGTIAVTDADTVATLAPKRQQLKSALDTVGSIVATWKDIQNRVGDGLSGYVGPDGKAVVDRAVSDFDRELAGLQSTNARVVSRIASLQLASETGTFRTAAQKVDEGTRLLNGVEEPTVEQGTTTTATHHYPGRALALFQDAQSTLKSLSDTLGGYIKDFEAGGEAVKTGELQATLSDLKSLSSSVDTLLGSVGDKIATAQKNEQLAQSLRNRADTSVREAAAAVQRNDVQTAINKIQEARTLSLQSLQLQHDAAYSQDIDKRLAALGDEIKRVNYVRVVNTVRDLITKGRGEYQQDQFAQAERDLLQARTLWAQVSPNEPQQEVENWLKLVQSALNLQNTRELTEVDPLFFTLGNYLNRAKENFAEGKQLYTSGNPQEGQKYIAKAEENIQSVVVARPFNQEARVLSLRILQLTNPKQFPEIFKQRFDEAVGRSKSEPQAALVDLYDLRAIDPNFPGLKDAIANLEIQLGIRPNPVTIAKKQQSDALVTEAQRLAATGTRAQTEVAIARLETALELNPDNTNAQVLLDRYRIAMGSPATYTLPSATMQEFNQAQNLFIAGRLADALAIVDRIWQNPTNRGYAPLVDLRKNILSRLGQ